MGPPRIWGIQNSPRKKEKIVVKDPLEGTPKKKMWSKTPPRHGSMGTTLLWGGVVGDPPFNLGGGSGTPPTFNLSGKAIFTVARSARKNFLGPFKSTQNSYWGTFELSHVKIFFGTPRQSCKKTFGVQEVKNCTFGREATKENYSENFDPKNRDF